MTQFIGQLITKCLSCVKDILKLTDLLCSQYCSTNSRILKFTKTRNLLFLIHHSCQVLIRNIFLCQQKIRRLVKLAIGETMNNLNLNHQNFTVGFIFVFFSTSKLIFVATMVAQILLNDGHKS